MPELLWPDRTMGVFETFLIVDGKLIELAAHLERLSGSVRELFGDVVPMGAREHVLDASAPLPLGRLRLTVAPGPGGALRAGVVTARVDPGDVFPSWERAIALRPFVVHGGLGAHKWADRDGIAWTEATEPDGGLPLILDVGEEVLEASRANIFAVDRELLITPPADGRILPGVARAAAIDSARALGIEVREERLPFDRLLAAGEAFLTGSVRGVEPVRSVGDDRLRAPGGTTTALAAEMKRRWLGEEDAARCLEAS